MLARSVAPLALLLCKWTAYPYIKKAGQLRVHGLQQLTHHREYQRMPDCPLIVAGLSASLDSWPALCAPMSSHNHVSES